MLKWVSKDNLITFWNEIRDNITSIVTEEVDEVVGPIIDAAKDDIVDNYIANILGDFGTVESSDQASQNYSVGAYLVYNKNFYKVISAITAGDTFTEDTNIEQTTVGEEMASKAQYLKKPDVQSVYYLGFVAQNNMIYVPMSNVMLNRNEITISDLAYVGINSVMACTPTSIYVNPNGINITVSESLSGYIGYQALVQINNLI